MHIGSNITNIDNTSKILDNSTDSSDVLMGPYLSMVTRIICMAGSPCTQLDPLVTPIHVDG